MFQGVEYVPRGGCRLAGIQPRLQPLQAQAPPPVGRGSVCNGCNAFTQLQPLPPHPPKVSLQRPFWLQRIRSAKKEDIGLTVVGPEEPLALGIVDKFHKAGLRIFGPSREAARVEASKVFAKQLMRHADVPSAEFRVCDHPDPARHYIQTREYPAVVKA